MIRINLLPFRAARKRENIRRQVSIYGLTVLFFIVVMGYFSWQLTNEIAGLQEEEKRLRVKLAEHRETIKRVNELNKRIKEIKTKLEVIGDLEKNKTGPVHLLDEVSMAVPKDQLWLTSLKESQGILTLKGTAKDNEVVALFMTNLERSKYIQAVDLESTRLKSLPEYKLKVSDFVLKCRTYAFKEKPKEEKKGKGRRGKKRR